MNFGKVAAIVCEERLIFQLWVFNYKCCRGAEICSILNTLGQRKQRIEEQVFSYFSKFGFSSIISSSKFMRSREAFVVKFQSCE